MNPQTAILFNSPALHALQRKQLISLCKRYRIKASGKNTDLISKLQAFGEQLPQDARVDPEFPLDSFVKDNCPPPATSSSVKPPRPSEPWSVLEGESAAADDEQMEVDDEDDNDTVKGRRGWKSAENGASELGEFGMPRSISASSLSRSTSKKLKSFLSGSLSRKAVGSIKTSKSAREGLKVDTFRDPAVASPAPQSPEPGVARAMRPSIAGEEPTIRMLEASSSASASLYPELPSMQDKRAEGRVPGGFPSSTFSSDSVVKTLEPSWSPAPFVFGSPMPSRQAFDFKSPGVAAPAFAFSSLAGTADVPQTQTSTSRDMRTVMQEEMRKLMAQKGVLDLPPPAPVENLFSREVLDSLSDKKDVKKRRFDDIHEKEFSKMPSILDHHSFRRTAPSTTAGGSKAKGRRLSTTATPRRPRQGKISAAANGSAHQPTTTATTSSRRVSALPTSAVKRVRPSRPLQPAFETPSFHKETSQNDRAAKKVKIDRHTTKPAPLLAPKPATGVADPMPKNVKAPEALPKSKSSRFGFLAQGMESVKTFASGLAKSGAAGPSLQVGTTLISRSTSASTVHKLQSKVPTASASIVVPTTSFATARFGFGRNEKVKASATAPTGMTRSESFSTRPGSTLLAPTASSRAKQAAANISTKSPFVKKPQTLPGRSSLASARLPQLATSAHGESKVGRLDSEAVKAGPSRLAVAPQSTVAHKSPLTASRPSVTNTPSSSKTPVKRGPQFKARVALKLSSQRSTTGSASSVGRPSMAGGMCTPGKQRSSVSASLVQKQAATPSGLHARAGAVAARKKASESVPTSSAASAARRHSLAGGLKARGRTSELARRKPSMHTPKKVLPKAPTTPFFPAVPLGGIAE